ncbi:MAG: CPBP family intramembrane metalloprotease [Culturomica sp.]|jgi:membrane protease YdiL (CAAX protease family)|nr:CPBP family intramembrane metalloprotease [Culturomica sp.]
MFFYKADKGKNRWYLYLIVTLLVFIGTQLGSMPLIIYALIQQPEQVMQGDISGIMSTNWGLALGLLSFVGGLFTLFWFAYLFQDKKPLNMVTGRTDFDWKRFFFGTGIWILLSLAGVAVSFLFEDTSDLVFQFDPWNFFILVVVALIMLPFQTGFEEVMFRGYLMQGSYLLFNSKWAAVFATSLLFGLMHGSNPEVEQFGYGLAMSQYILMGLIMGAIVVWDDGLELAIGMHFGNNLLSALLITSDSSALQTHALFKDTNPSASWTDVVMLLVGGVLFIWICHKKFRFSRLNFDTSRRIMNKS